MKSFLELVVKHLYDKYTDGIQDICLVFPGRRAGLFFMQQFKELVKNKPMWAPRVKTISELISDLSHLQVADSLKLNFELYKVYKNIRKTDEDFDSFFSFGEMLLNDFDDIDKYLADTKQLFQNISDLRDIENKFSLSPEQMELILQFWKNVNIYEAGPLKKNFIGIWNQLHAIYENFNKVLLQHGIAYEGMMYRQVCNDIKNGHLTNNRSEKYAIIGFNALNECEKVFFSYLQKNHQVDFYWDYDDYYVQNNWHEAGYFIRQNLDKFPNSLTPSEFSNLTSNKKIEIIAAPSDVGQAKLLPTILDTFPNAVSDLSDTLIVLADEQLLIPVLSSLPEKIKDVNVTLGYPFRLTHVYGFLELLMKLQKNSRKSENSFKFYHNDVIALLNHPYCRISNETQCSEIIQNINENNRIYISADDLGKNRYFEQIFKGISDTPGFINYIFDIGSYTVNELKNSERIDENTNFQIDYWFTFLTTVNRLKEIITQEHIELGITVLYRLLRKIFAGLSTPFKGEPLAGLQIMGVLETRAIDFSNVIILSANEGIFPKTESAPSYIPYNLRKGFGLPTLEHQDAIYAYYFYRLLQRAQNIVITYNSQQTGRAGEMSRYLYQLRYENVFHIHEKSIGFSIHLSEENEIRFPKNQSIIEFLQFYTSNSQEPRYLTPTALSAYLECSLRFYFRYIAQIKEKEEITDDIEGSVFGKLLHFAMETLYKGYKGQTITSGIIDTIIEKDNIEKAILEAFASEHYINLGSKEPLHGKSLLIKEILIKYITEILEKDRRIAPFTMIALEEKMRMQLPFGSFSVNIGGVIDRIDKIHNTYRIIDYKTGMVEYNCNQIETIFDREGDTHKYAPIFQSMLYSLVLKSNPEYTSSTVYPGLYGLRKIFQHDFDSSITVNKEKINDIEPYKEVFVSNLKNILHELFDPHTPITQTKDKKKCEKCSYKEICGR